MNYSVYEYISISRINMKQNLITSYFLKQPRVIKGYNKKTKSWHCIVCGENMGTDNSRQLCYKSYCPSDMF